MRCWTKIVIYLQNLLWHLFSREINFVYDLEKLRPKNDMSTLTVNVQWSQIIKATRHCATFHATICSTCWKQMKCLDAWIGVFDWFPQTVASESCGVKLRGFTHLIWSGWVFPHPSVSSPPKDPLPGCVEELVRKVRRDSLPFFTFFSFSTCWFGTWHSKYYSTYHVTFWVICFWI